MAWVTFDHFATLLPAIERQLCIPLLARRVFLLDLDDGDDAPLLRFLNCLRTCGGESLTVGVLVRLRGHTTALFVQRIALDSDSDGDYLVMRHLDSFALDFPDSEVFEELLERLVQSGEIRTLVSSGFRDQERRAGLRRQDTDGSCAVYAFHDLCFEFKRLRHRFPAHGVHCLHRWPAGQLNPPLEEWNRLLFACYSAELGGPVVPQRCLRSLTQELDTDGMRDLLFDLAADVMEAGVPCPLFCGRCRFFAQASFHVRWDPSQASHSGSPSVPLNEMHQLL